MQGGNRQPSGNRPQGQGNWGNQPGGPGNQGFQPGAQKGDGRISGIVMDSTLNQPIEFATVALINSKTNKPVDGGITDDKGKFVIKEIANGDYRLEVSFIGFGTKRVELSITDKKYDIHIGTLKIAPSAEILKEVVVEGQKTLVEEKVDRTIYNAENDITAKGGDATDVLKRVPMLSVDLDGNVSLRGSQNIRVLINNKPSTIAASSVADALKQIPADQIKSVEVITSPSAKYDAEGSAGIINIITKKNNMQGLTLNVDAGTGLRGSNLGLNGSYRVGKMGFSLGGFGRAGYNVTGISHNEQTTTSAFKDINGLDSILTRRNVQDATTRNNNLFGHYNLGWDYDINKYNSLTASARLGIRNMNNYQDNFATASTTLLNGTQQSAFNSLRNVFTPNDGNNMDLSMNYQRTFPKAQREFNVLALYSRNNQTGGFNYSNLDPSTTSILGYTKNVNKSFNQESTIQIDYQEPIGTNQLIELGVKDIARKVSSDYKYFIAGSDGVYSEINSVNQPSNVLNYEQNVTAGYLAYTLNAGKGYSLKAGSRYEYTTIKAHLQDDKPIDIPSYGVLVPSLNLSKKLANGKTIKLAYNRRIQRPSLQFLNPNRQSNNPPNVSEGNPTLSPEYTNNYELGYSTFIKGTTLNFSTFVRNTNNSIQSVRSIDTLVHGILTTYKNIGSENAYGFSIFANINISNKFSLNGGTDTYYAVLKNNVSDPLYNASNQGWVYNIRAFGNYNLVKGWAIQFFGFYRGRQVQLQGYQGGFGVYSLGFRKDIAEKKGSLGFRVENFLTNGITVRNSLSSPILVQSGKNVMHNTNFLLTFSYRIGKMSFDAPRKRKKSIENDDMKEGGDNQNQNQQNRN
ncbi:MAG: TonB-dependent receptor [Cyclobacteriaceae bacterium]|nr:TonB-dependent receptor [Cyclobacteriaceae bacterium]